MPLPSETVSLAGSGLVFVNDYSNTVTAAYRGAVIAAENQLQSHFTDAITINVAFDYQPLGGGTTAQNQYTPVTVSYGQFVAALAARASTPDDMLAIAGLPTADPTQGVGIQVPWAEARLLGLAGDFFGPLDKVTLSSSAGYTFGQDAIGVLEHELTEGVFGRVGSLVAADGAYAPMDLFRFNAAGLRDFTGGADGVKTFFGVDGAHVTTLAFNASINAAGVYNGHDLADWSSAPADSFGGTTVAAPGTVTATDLRVLDILGWTPSGAAAGAGTGTPSGGDDVLAGGLNGDTLDGGAGDDVITGGFKGANYLRGGDGADIVNGGSAFDDINGNQGNDTAHGNAGDDWVVGGKGDDVLFGDAGDDIVWGNLGNDTLDGGSGNDQVRGGQGDDVLNGGAGNDFLSGDRGNDTITGGSGADIFHGSQDAGIDRVLDFHLAEGDRVMLDPGTTYTVSQVGADTVIDMGGGNQMILVGVQMSSLTPGWIFEG
jgi:Ca2+-binding RTX toxin-like protein